MCKNCQNTYAASFAPASMAITNPELIWSQVQEQKRISAASSRTATAAAAAKASSSPSSSSSPPAAQSSTTAVPSSDAASTFSESTTLSYDKEEDRKVAGPKKSMRQRIKGVWGGSQSSTTAP
ncbi:hypothetical protein F5X96DRAFT_628816 [Biscogniauxia mediterranea]|nr:hypothetical protein F5X96DRAFT_628816 [Biscogniauxia mediterranea]